MGLDSFKSDDEDKDTGKPNNGKDEPARRYKYTHGIPPIEWNQMSKSERVKRVRANGMEDYHPEYKPDGDWKFMEVAKVKCVCNNTFIVDPVSGCEDCGRVYKKTNRTVIKKPDTE